MKVINYLKRTDFKTLLNKSFKMRNGIKGQYYIFETSKKIVMIQKKTDYNKELINELLKQDLSIKKTKDNEKIVFIVFKFSNLYRFKKNIKPFLELNNIKLERIRNIKRNEKQSTDN